MPEGEGNEAYINMNNVMRQLGCRQEAFEFTWMQLQQAVTKDGGDYQQPQAIDCKVPIEDGEPEGTLQVVCVKYGTKYGADYVNKLYYGVK